MCCAIAAMLSATRVHLLAGEHARLAVQGEVDRGADVGRFPAIGARRAIDPELEARAQLRVLGAEAIEFGFEALRGIGGREWGFRFPRLGFRRAAVVVMLGVGLLDRLPEVGALALRRRRACPADRPRERIAANGLTHE